MDMMDGLANTIASFNTMNYFSRFLILEGAALVLAILTLLT